MPQKETGFVLGANGRPYVHDEHVFPQDKPEGVAGLARSGGLGLRDYFASHAPAITVQAPTVEGAAEGTANWAYTYADAMMRRRLQK